MDRWYYKVFGDVFGPVPLEELMALAKCQGISLTDEVRFGDNGQWCPVSAIEELVQQIPQKSHTAPSPPVSPAPPPSPATASAPGPAPAPPSDSRANPPPRPSRVEAPPSAAAPVKNIVWYYKVFGVEYGPVTFEQLIELARNQTLYKNDEVRFVELGQWCQAGSIGELIAKAPLQSERPVFVWNNQNVAYGQMAPAAWQAASAASASIPPVDATNIAPPADDLWWCKIKGQVYGPVDWPKVVSWGASGVMSLDDYVRHGTGEYVLASEMPDLFPISPAMPAVEVKLDPPKPAQLETVPRPYSSAESSSATVESELKSTSRLTYSPPNPYSSPASASRHKPAIPDRRSSNESSDETFVEKLTNFAKQLAIPAAAVLAVGLLVMTVYAILPLLTESNTANIERLKDLQTALAEIQRIRAQKGATNDDFKEAVTNLESTASDVEKETRGSRTESQKLIRSLSKTFLLIAEQKDFMKPSPAEKAADQLIPKLKRRFGVP